MEIQRTIILPRTPVYLDQDEFLPHPTGFFHLEQEDNLQYTQQLVNQNQQSLVGIYGDEAYHASISTIIDEDYLLYFSQLRTFQEKATTNQTVFQYDYEYSTNLSNFYLEQEEFLYSTIQVISQVGRIFSDDEYSSNLYFSLEQEEFLYTTIQSISQVGKVFTDDEVSTHLSNFGLDQQEFIYTTLQTPWINTKYSTDDETLNTESLGVDDEANPFTTLQIINWIGRSNLDDEISTNLKNFGIDQEDYSPTTIQYSTFTPFTVLDEHSSSNLTNFGMDQEDYYPSSLQNTLTVGRIFSDDEYSTHLSYFYLEQEEFQYTSIQVISQVGRIFSDDEISSISFIHFDQDDNFNTTIQIINWKSFVFIDDEIRYFPPIIPFYLEDESSNYIYYQGQGIWVSPAFLDDEILSTVSQFYKRFNVWFNYDPLPYNVVMNYDPLPYNVWFSMTNPIKQDMEFTRGQGAVYNFNAKGGSAAQPNGYAGWNIVFQMSLTDYTLNPPVTTAYYTQTLQCIDTVNGIFTLTILDTDMNFVDLPFPTYNYLAWRTDVATGDDPVRLGKVKLVYNPRVIT